jgi:hypothetical protein
VLDTHNPFEEMEDGVYAQCERLAGAEIDKLRAQIADAPRVPVSAWMDSPKVIAAAKRVLIRAGYNGALLSPDELKL